MKQLALFILVIFISLCGCQDEKTDQHSLSHQQNKVTQNNGHNVIVILIDSMTEKVMDKGLKEGRLPALQYLIDHGTVFHDLVAPFPSMSVTIESTLLTGDSPDKHSIPGLNWYDETSDSLISYGDSISSMWKLGRNDVIDHTLSKLNNEHLNKNSTTIYESLKQKGLTTGSINMLVYRGDISHTLTVPAPFKTILQLESETIKTKGPDILAFGKAIQPEIKGDVPDGITERLGLTDRYSAEVIAQLIKDGQQPNFLMTFFPDFDKLAHHHGPYAIDHFSKVDHNVQTILNAYESWEEALSKNTFIVLGDHGQSELIDNKEAVGIDLESLISPYSVASLFESPSSGDIIIANNHRMAYLYLNNEELTFFRVGEQLLQDDRIEHIAWIENDEVVLQKQGLDGYLRFKEGGVLQDDYDQNWTLNGNRNIAHISITDNYINYNDYPDIFHQLDSALKSHNNTLIVTAKPGYTLKTEGAPVHVGGGEHGGLHKTDTLTSIIVSNKKNLPEKRRMIDLFDYFHTFFN
ncbi:alkaline phosphatase family protein [Alkalihalobacillus hemicellulosilyticus]|uniref:Alkaline phosphodiesterase I n=1 Tax=Halalkalibacter hemicellulosilyticusJCM 9152 TaxID=1236971 RepID=W4QC59_9BACI|nr:alkaline phosphatase family protein [Halalkalibacter hemicellulosilyticus]GAE28944.1 hypothetical protein JCM9152_282 [Halalkalibacter hemicellulosilyticusJCM 9152]